MSQYSELTKRALLSYPIVGVLSALGKRTDRPAGHGFFFSPFREERHPSFQINESANVWTDWGTGDKGGVLDLVCRLKGCSRPDAMDFLASLSPASIIDEYDSCPGHKVAAKGNITIDGVFPLESRALLHLPALRRYATFSGNENARSYAEILDALLGDLEKTYQVINEMLTQKRRTI